MVDDNQRRAELKAFLFITVIMFPILAVAVVGWLWLFGVVFPGAYRLITR